MIPNHVDSSLMKENIAAVVGMLADGPAGRGGQSARLVHAKLAAFFCLSWYPSTEDSNKPILVSRTGNEEMRSKVQNLSVYKVEKQTDFTYVLISSVLHSCQFLIGYQNPLLSISGKEPALFMARSEPASPIAKAGGYLTRKVLFQGAMPTTK